MTDTQLILPRHSSNFGVDWGAKRRVLAAVRPNPYWGEGAEPGVMLFINEGFSAAHGARGFGRDYHPARLILLKRDAQGRREDTTLAEGRITKAVVAQHADKINGWFGRDVVSGLDLKKTLWVERD